VESRAHNVASWLARHEPERLAVVDAERALTYAELDARAGRLARVLEAAGAGSGERVALLLANRSAYLEAVFACARLGAIAVPLNNRLAPPEIARELADCSPRALLVESELAGRVSSPPACVLVAGTPYEKALAAAGPPAPPRPLSPDHPLLLMYTSGTTGTPKGALLPQRKTLFNSLNAQIVFGLGRDDRVLVALPLFHSFGLNILSLPVLYAGGTVYLQPRFDPERVWQAVAEERITFFGAVPTMFQRLLDALDARPRELPSLRFLFTAGAAIPVDVIRAYERHGLVLKQGFGQTETSMLTCLDARDALRKAGSVGRPVFHAEVRVVANPDERPSAWRDAAPGEAGEIVVRGPIAMLGYWNRPAETAAVLREDWLRTGDLARSDAEGFIELVGRARDMYISGGENVYPAEVEAVYAAHPEIADVAVVATPDPRWGETGRAYVVPAAGARPDAQALRAFGLERLAPFKVPGEFRFVAELPRTESGKVQKHRLAEIEPG
jgi:fatty-acyl-CoA synthase